MRDTNSTLIRRTLDIVRNSDTSSIDSMTPTPDFVQRAINDSVRAIVDYLLSHKIEGDEVIVKTVADQQFYPYPPRLNWLSNVTWEVGGVKYVLEVVESEDTWSRLNMVDYSGSTLPQYIYPRKADFGLYPKPQTNDQDITLSAYYIPKNMSQVDVTAGTITIDNGETAVVGVGTDFTSDMVGRWIEIAGDWYRIDSVTDSENLDISRAYYSPNITGSSYVIGESPDIPEVLHEFIPYKAASAWFANNNGDYENAQANLNYFWTGDYNNPNRDETMAEGGIIGYTKRARKRGREASQLVKRGQNLKFLFNESWTTQLSE